MSKTLTLSLNKKLIIEAVKADTYITGAIDKSTDVVKNAAFAYNEQAGDDMYHERKLTRTLAGAVGSLEANLAEFVDSSVPDAISDTLASAGQDGAFSIVIKVSDRYNSGLAYPIAQLSQEYIVNKMLYYWWQSIKPTLAKDYLSFSTESLTNIRLCLAKSAPTIASAQYEDVTGDITSISSEQTVTVDITLAQASGKYTVARTTFLGYYALQGNLTIECSDPNAAFTAKVGDNVIFSFGSTPYTVTAANIAKLTAEEGTNLEFIPEDTLQESNVLIIKHVS